MCCCCRLLTLFLLAEGGKLYKDIDPVDIRLRIREKSNTLNVTWKNPNKLITPGCYRSHLQYRSHCDPDWREFRDLRSFHLPDRLPAKGRNYKFRVRMRYECLNFNWSAWTAESRWTGGDILDICSKDISAVMCTAIVVIPVVFLLVFLAVQKQIRRLFLPRVPDPKHVYEDLLKIDQSQLGRTFKETCCVESATLTIESVHLEEDEEEEERERDEAAGTGHAGQATVIPNTATWPSNCPMLTAGHSPYVCW